MQQSIVKRLEGREEGRNRDKAMIVLWLKEQTTHIHPEPCLSHHAASAAWGPYQQDNYRVDVTNGTSLFPLVHPRISDSL